MFSYARVDARTILSSAIDRLGVARILHFIMYVRESNAEGSARLIGCGSFVCTLNTTRNLEGGLTIRLHVYNFNFSRASKVRKKNYTRTRNGKKKT